MNKYDMKDFFSYFGRSWFLHPNSGEIVRILDIDPALPNSNILIQRAGNEEVAKAESISLEQLDWKHMATPKLGFRTLGNGHELYYVTRRAGRRTAKGVTPEAIQIEVPSSMRMLYAHLEHRHENPLGLENLELVEQIYNPKFVNLAEAVESLRTDKHALGLALSPNWAVTMGLYKEEPFLLLFKNIRVGGGDGDKWNFYDPASKELFDSSSIRG